MNITLSVLALFLLPAAVLAAGEKTIYGPDSRHDFYEVRDQAQLTAMRTAVSVFRDTALREDGDDFVVGGRPFGHESRGICPGQRFFRQHSAAYCSGALIAPDLVVTAGHCMGEKNKPASRCDKARFVFGFSVDRADGLPVKVPKADVYSCAEVKIYSNGAAGDFAVVRLDRAVSGRASSRFVLTSPPAAGTAIFTVGGPYGLPLKVVDDAAVRSLSEAKTFFRTDLDTSGGNSGGGIFRASDGALVGVHTASWDPDLVETDLPAGHGLPPDDERVKTGKCKIITALGQDDGNGKKGFALSAIPGLRALIFGEEGKAADMPPVEELPAGRGGLPGFGGFQ
ncbi:MAG: trypsin-like serine peptidase [Elusimicrobiales bacterium]